MSYRKYELECLLDIKKRIDENPLKNFTLSSLEADTGIPRKRLTYGYRSMTGLSISKYHENAKLEKIKELLLENDLSIKEVAAKGGFKSTSNFCFIFRRKIGVTPEQFRRLDGLESLTA